MSREAWSTIDNSIVGPQLLKLAETHAAEIRTRYSPNLAPFMDKDVYGRAAVFEDLKKVAAQEKLFERDDTPQDKEKKRVANVFEAYFIDAANTQQWLGPQSRFDPTTKYDDYFNQVDGTGTFKEGAGRYGHIGFSTDLTYGYDASTEKIEDIISAIDAKRMSKIRYFHSEAMGYTGQLSNLPKTVLGLDKVHVGDFIRLWTHDPTNPEISQFRNIIVLQLVRQLRFFTDYADKKHGESIIRNNYAQALNHMEGIWKQTGLRENDVPRDSITDHVSR